MLKVEIRIYCKLELVSIDVNGDIVLYLSKENKKPIKTLIDMLRDLQDRDVCVSIKSLSPTV